jgi:hypothetical protein
LSTATLENKQTVKALFISYLTNMKLASLPVLISLPSSILAAIGDPCLNGWTAGCICVDRGVCNSYGGIAVEGWSGEYPCPNDPANVWGCYVEPCPQIGGGTGCTWRSQCTGLVMPGKTCLMNLKKTPPFIYTT